MNLVCRRLSAVAVSLVVAGGVWLGVCCAPVLALQTHPFVGSFGSFAGVDGVALDPASGDVYVVDSNANRVDKFDSSGSPVAGWALSGITGPSAGGLSFPYGAVVDPATGDLYVTDNGNGVVDKFDSSGGFISEFSGSATPAGSFSPTGLAVDAAGDVFVADQPNGVVDEFSSGGVYTGNQFGAGVLSVPTGVAVDSAGDVYVASGFSEAFEFGPTGTCLNSCTPLDTGGSLGVTVDPGSGHVFVLDTGYVAEYDSTGGLVDQFGQGRLSDPFGLAVNDASGDLYVGDYASTVASIFGPLVTIPDVAVTPASGVQATSATLDGTVNPDGIAVAGCQFEYGTDTTYGTTVPCDQTAAQIGSGSSPVAVTAEISGLQPDTTYHYRLDATNANGTSQSTDGQFTTLAAPTVDGQFPTGVSETGATLSAQINPNGSDTTYRFEYGTTSGYGTSVPVPDADIGSGSTDVAVSQQIQGLQAGTTYHFRVVATSANGTTDSSDRTLTTYPPPPPAQSCPNAQYRPGESANLPDCRAYELVTPVDSEPAMNTFNAEYEKPASVQASVTGDGMGWFSYFNPADVPSNGHYFLSTRGSSGWSTAGVIPPQSTEDANLCLPTMAFYSSDLSEGLLADGPPYGYQGQCGSDEPPLVAGEPTGYQNLFIRDNATGSYQLVNVTPAGAVPNTSICATTGTPNSVGCGHPQPLAASSDLSHVVFDETAQLTADAPGGGADDLFEWSGGAVRLVTYLPDGTPVAGAFPNDPSSLGFGIGDTFRHPVSDDGSRVVFVANGNLYVRENPMAAQSPVSGEACTVAADACTVQVDAPRGGSGSGGGGQFTWASSDGSEVFFTDDASAGLTADTVAGSGQNLYRYDVATNTLTDLTPDAQAGVGGVAGASADGAYVYFEATGALTSAPDGQGASAHAGQPNLYLYHGTSATFIATLSPTPSIINATNRPFDTCDWTESCLTARVSPSGRFIAFNSIESLTGYDNVPSNPEACDIGQGAGSPCTEIYLYDAAAGTLSCASCNPSGAKPTGSTWIRQPTVPIALSSGFPPYLQRNLSDTGQVLFDSPDPLVPQASNGQQNVYEYEGGQIHLLSSGTSSDPSFFFDATPSGNDMFIWTTQPLVPQAAGASASIYDVRVDGGFPAPATPPPPCSGDACLALSAAPAPPTAASVSFAGPGDLAGSASTAGKVRVLTRIVHGSTFLVAVSVPGAGRITVSGARVRTVRRSVARAGTYKLKVTLAASAARAMRAGGHGLKLNVRLGFAAGGGTASTVMVPLTVQPAIAHRAKRATRRIGRQMGGAR